MSNSQAAVALLDSSELLARTRELVDDSSRVEADLLLHLAEVDERKLYRDLAFPSMFAYCVGELGFSEDAAYNRIFVARASRRFPAIIDSIRAARVHLYGVRLLVPHLTEANCAEVLAEAAGKSRREIEFIVARLSPRPPVPTIVCQLRDRPALPTPLVAAPTQATSPSSVSVQTAPLLNATPLTAALREETHRSIVAPLSEATFKIQFTATRGFHDKLREAQGLLRHRIPDGDVATILESALDALLETVRKQRFGVGCKPRSVAAKDETEPASRYIPMAIRRAVFERDGGRCTFIDERGHRCPETSCLEFDHVDGFARHRVHDVNSIRLRCRAHNQHAAEQMYGREFMARARAALSPDSTCSRTSSTNLDSTARPDFGRASGTDSMPVPPPLE